MTLSTWGLIALIAAVFIAALAVDEMLDMAGLKDTKKDCGDDR